MMMQFNECMLQYNIQKSAILILILVYLYFVKIEAFSLVSKLDHRTYGKHNKTETMNNCKNIRLAVTLNATLYQYPFFGIKYTKFIHTFAKSSFYRQWFGSQKYLRTLCHLRTFDPASCTHFWTDLLFLIFCIILHFSGQFRFYNAH